MKTGIELIAEERQEQIKKHGYSLSHDITHESDELLHAAIYAIDPCPANEKLFNWPGFQMKIMKKEYVDRLKIAGALIAAEIDRYQAINGKTD